MKTAGQQFRENFFRQAGMYIQLEEDQFSFIKQPEEILRELIRSKKTGSFIAIHSPELGEKVFLVAVADVHVDEKNEHTVNLKPHDVSGKPLQKRTLLLSQIRSVAPVNKTSGGSLKRKPKKQSDLLNRSRRIKA